LAAAAATSSAIFADNKEGQKSQLLLSGHCHSSITVPTSSSAALLTSSYFNSIFYRLL
jgi:hypothetical protein